MRSWTLRNWITRWPIQTKQVAILTSERNLLRTAATEDPTKLAESELVDLKRKAAWEEFRFLKWQQQFLEIKAPVIGMEFTKDVESLSGKKFKAGEPFCELNVTNDLSAEVFVPDDKITHVKAGQTLVVYLSGQPTKGYHLKVAEIAPTSRGNSSFGQRVQGEGPSPNPRRNYDRYERNRQDIYRQRYALEHSKNRLVSQFQKWAIHFYINNGRELTMPGVDCRCGQRISYAEIPSTAECCSFRMSILRSSAVLSPPRCLQGNE